jgi:predicted GH43/DUF377 family glycosyl hydrolase
MNHKAALTIPILTMFFLSFLSAFCLFNLPIVEARVPNMLPSFTHYVNASEGSALRQPVISCGDEGTPMNGGVRDASCIKIGSYFYLAVTAYSTTDGANQATICLYNSTDKIHWNLMGIILQSPNFYCIDPYFFDDAVNNKLYLFFGTGNETSGGVPTLPEFISVATCTDITNTAAWAMYNDGAPIISPGFHPGIDDLAVTSPCVFQPPNRTDYVMYYAVQQDWHSRGICYSTSTNLVNWTFGGLLIPEDQQVENPTVWYDKIQKLYFMGVNFVDPQIEATVKNLIYFSDSYLSWNTSDSFTFFSAGSSGWDSVVCGSMAMYINESGVLCNVWYDGGNMYSHFNHEIGLITVTWVLPDNYTKPSENNSVSTKSNQKPLSYSASSTSSTTETSTQSAIPTPTPIPTSEPTAMSTLPPIPTPTPESTSAGKADAGLLTSLGIYSAVYVLIVAVLAVATHKLAISKWVKK